MPTLDLKFLFKFMFEYFPFNLQVPEGPTLRGRLGSQTQLKFFQYEVSFSLTGWSIL